MGLYRINETKSQSLSTPATFTIQFEMLSFADEYKAIYNQNTQNDQNKKNTQTEQKIEKKPLDLSQKMKGRMTPLKILLLHSDFLLLMKCLFFNIAYDDLKDEMMVSNYVPAKKPEKGEFQSASN